MGRAREPVGQFQKRGRAAAKRGERGLGLIDQAQGFGGGGLTAERGGQAVAVVRVVDQLKRQAQMRAEAAQPRHLAR